MSKEEFELITKWHKAQQKREVEAMKNLPPEDRAYYRERGELVPLHLDEPPMGWKLKIGDLEIEALFPVSQTK